MFNWFKSKIELKNNTCIMSSIDNKKGIKIGSEIVVFNNFECLIFHNGKLFNTLSSGKYKIDKTTFAILIDEQHRLKSKPKYVKFIAHYVNTSKQKIELKFKKQKFLVEFCIEIPIKFVELMLLYTYKVDNNYSYSYLNEIFKELLSHYKGDYKQIASTALSSYGITINNFAPISKSNLICDTPVSILSAHTSLINQNKSSSSTQNIQPSNNTDTQHAPTQSVKSSSNLDTSTTLSNQPAQHQVTFPTCPKCGNAVKFTTTYCLKCGHKFSN